MRTRRIDGVSSVTAVEGVWEGVVMVVVLIGAVSVTSAMTRGPNGWIWQVE
jgi:hypothetical protein